MRGLVSCALIFLLASSMGSAAQAKASQHHKAPSQNKQQQNKQRGQASWYGDNHQGKRTASGEKFDMNSLTAAHRTLPMNSVVQVKSLRTGKAVKVRINDRGPFARGRIIDVSKAAAKQLGMMKRGTDKVEITVISTPRKPASQTSLKKKKAF